jgi:hypothetical protein
MTNRKIVDVQDLKITDDEWLLIEQEMENYHGFLDDDCSFEGSTKRDTVFYALDEIRLRNIDSVWLNASTIIESIYEGICFEFNDSGPKETLAEAKLDHEVVCFGYYKTVAKLRDEYLRRYRLIIKLETIVSTKCFNAANSIQDQLDDLDLAA